MATKDEQLRAEHVAVERIVMTFEGREPTGEVECEECSEPWPCTTIRLLDRLAELEEENAMYRRMVGKAPQ
jgi:hypothetical protein